MISFAWYRLNNTNKMNLLDLRKKYSLNFVFDKEGNENIFNKRTAVFVNLYYYDTLSLYYPYIKNACRVSNVYITSSNDKVIERTNEFILENGLSEVCKIIKKINRGRDLSGLLVTFAPYILQYEYVCFIHDKEFTHYDVLNRDRKEWVIGYWENLLASPKYICDIFRCFDAFENLGMLVSPEPFGSYNTAYYRNCWDSCFDQTKQLAIGLHVNAELDSSYRPVAVSTAFWAKSECLEKLYNKQWKYEDFPKEPLPYPCISHAIERLIGYLPQDCGMTIGTVQTRENNSDLKEKSQDALIKGFDVLKSVIDVDTVAGVEAFINFRDKITEYVADHKCLYLYGTGVVGTRYLKWIKALGYEVDGFIVSEKTYEEYMGYSVFSVKSVKDDDSSGIIISVSSKYQKEVISELTQIGYTDYLVIE